jgi:hypothetical protein
MKGQAMRVVPGLAALAVAVGVVLGVGVTPAVADPKVPAGCTFDGGVLTCVTTAVTQTTDGPFTAPTPVATLGGFTASQVCSTAVGRQSDYDTVQIVGPGLFLTVSVTTTTTTMQHGLHGKLFRTSSVTGSPVLVGLPGIGDTYIVCVSG